MRGTWRKWGGPARRLAGTLGVAIVCLNTAACDFGGSITADQGTVVKQIDMEDEELVFQVGATGRFRFDTSNPDLATSEAKNPGANVNPFGRITGVTVRWTSDNPAIVIVSTQDVVSSAPSSANPTIQRGYGASVNVRAVGQGTTTITGTVIGAKTPNGAPVTTKLRITVYANESRVVVMPANLTVAVGGQATITGQLLDPAGNVLPFSPFWECTSSIIRLNGSSLNADCSGTDTVLNGGHAVTVFGRAPGTTRIRVYSSTVPGVETFVTVTVAVPVRVAVAPPSAQVVTGGTRQLTASVFDAAGSEVPNAPVTWLTKNASIATVSATGLVTAVATGATQTTPSGIVQITARAADGVEAVANVTVYRPVSDVTVTLRDPRLAPGRTTVAQAILHDDNGSVIPLTATSLTWSSNDPSVATVDQSGNVTTVAAGSARIAATTREGVIGRATIDVASPSPAVVVTPATPSIAVGDSVKLVALVANATGAIDVTWSPASNAYVTVTKTGPTTATVRGVSVTPAGSPTSVTASYTQGGTTVTATSAVTVTAAILSATYKLLPSVGEVIAGGPTESITIGVERANGFAGAVSFVSASGAPTGLTVASSGSFTGPVVAVSVAATAAVAPGTYPVTVTTSAPGLANQSTTLTITVKAPAAVPSVALTLAPTTLAVTQGGSSATTRATLTRGGGFTGTVGATVAGAPAGLTVTSSPATGTTGNTIDLTVAPGTAAAGTYTLTVTPATSAGVAVTPATLTVTVNAAPAGTAIVAVYFDPRNAEITAPATLTYHARLIDAQGNEVSLAAAGGSLVFSSVGDPPAPAPKVAIVTPFGTDGAFAKGNTAGKTTIRVTYTKGTQVLTDETPLTVYAAGTAGYYGAVEISTAGDTRRLKVGQEIIVQVLVRDVNGIQQLTGVQGLTFPLTSNPALQITRDTSFPNGYYYKIKALAATSPTGVEVRADLEGAASSIVLVVTP